MVEHEQVNEKAVALAVKGAKITGRMLARAMQAFLNQMTEVNQNILNNQKRGKQSVKSLTKQGASLSNIEITDRNIGSFKRTARRYNIDFSLKRDNAETPPKWMVFFKAKDADAMTAAFKEYSKRILKDKTKKPSMLAKLNRYKALAKSQAAPAKHRSKGEIEV